MPHTFVIWKNKTTYKSYVGLPEKIPHIRVELR